MRRTALIFVLLIAALGLVAAGCGGEEQQSATPETVTGEVTPPETETTTETGNTGTETTGTETTETTTTETTPPAPKGDPVAGKAIFLGPSGCTGCHTLADAGSTGNVGPNLDDAQAELRSRVRPRDERSRRDAVFRDEPHRPAAGRRCRVRLVGRGQVAPFLDSNS